MKKIAVLDNVVQAKLLESMLKDEGIPHVITTHYDSAYDGLYQSRQGWGHVKAPEEYESQILKLLEDIQTE